MHRFCVHCGFKNLYDSSPPKFCGGCGLAADKAIRPSTSNSSRQNDDEDDDSDDDDDIYESLNINKRELAKDWVVDMPETKLGIGSFQDLAIHQSSPKIKLPPRAIPKDVKALNAKNIIKATIQECAKPKTSREIG